MSKLKLLSATAVIAIAATACTERGPSRAAIGAGAGAVAGGVAGNQFGSGTGNIAATVGGALLGALLGGAIGSALDAEEEAKWEQATAGALSSPGQPVQWNKPGGHSGQVTATDAPSYGTGCYKVESLITYPDGRQEVRETHVRFDTQTQLYVQCT